MKHPVFETCSVLPLLIGLAGGVFAAEPKAMVEDRCGGCHALQEPDYDALGIAERIDRKAPPLFYAGNKFRRDWLVSWLQEPQRIRPAGYFPPANTVPGEEQDQIKEENLQPHLKLSAQEAEAAADYLMTLKPYDERINAVSYEPGSISMRMGQLNFGKFNGCDACHRDVPDWGGLSGPELYTAWNRLQPKFIASFIADPVAWDPHTLMPKKDLNDGVIGRLTNYLKAIGEEEQP